jgi:hypothetical protein
MTWWWPFGEAFGRKKIRKVAPLKLRHSEIAAHYFWMPKVNQLKVLFFLGVSDSTKRTIIHASMKPYKDVKLVMETQGEPEKPFSPELFMDQLKAMELQGKLYIVEAVLHNFFHDMKEAKAYVPAVKGWPAELRT